MCLDFIAQLIKFKKLQCCFAYHEWKYSINLNAACGKKQTDVVLLKAAVIVLWRVLVRAVLTPFSIPIIFTYRE